MCRVNVSTADQRNCEVWRALCGYVLVRSMPRSEEKAAGSVTVPDNSPLQSGGRLRVCSWGENLPNSLSGSPHKPFCQLVGAGKVGLSFFWSSTETQLHAGSHWRGAGHRHRICSTEEVSPRCSSRSGAPGFHQKGRQDQMWLCRGGLKHML